MTSWTLASSAPSLDTETVRRQLKEIYARLDRNEYERRALISMHAGLEGMLRLMTPPPYPVFEKDYDDGI